MTEPVAQQDNVKEVELICDGSVYGNPGPGGWACVIKIDDPSIEIEPLTGFEKHTTNQRMELAPILAGLRDLSKRAHFFMILDFKVRIITDSLYAIKVLTKVWKAKKNRDLIGKIWKEMGKHEVWFKYVRHEENEAHTEALKVLHDNLGEMEFGPF